MLNSIALDKPAAVPARYTALDTTKVVLAIMVVGLHGHFLMDVAPAVSDFLENYLFRVAVPTFFVINGYFLRAHLDRGKPMWAWVRRVLALYAAWSLAYSYFIFKPGIGIGLRVLVLLGYWHLWYLLAIAWAAGLLYAMRAWRIRHQAAAFAVAYGAGLAMQYAGNYHVFHGSMDAVLNKNYVYRNFLFFAMPMMGIGFLMAQARVHLSGRSAHALLGLGLVLLVGEYAGNKIAGLAASEGFDMLASLPIVAAGLFAVGMGRGLSTPKIDAAAISSAIYLAHPLFLLVLPALGIGGETTVVLTAIAGCLALYPLLKALDRRLSFVL